jgi:uncharacterized membrane protein YadS
MMRRILAGAALCVLASCSQMGAPATVVSQAQQACVTVQPILNAASAVADPRVQSIVGYGNAVCGPLAVGSVPPTVDANTPQWLGSLAGMLKVLAPIALSLL